MVKEIFGKMYLVKSGTGEPFHWLSRSKIDFFTRNFMVFIMKFMAQIRKMGVFNG
jgi:hypothetical protein